MSRRFWTSLVSELVPYTPGEQPQVANLLKLNTNESPYPPSPDVLQAIASVDGDDLLRYPDPRATLLRDAIAKYHDLTPEHVFLGNGSDEVLSHIFLGLLKHSKPVLFPDICYSFYPVWCQLHQIDFRTVALREDFSIAVEDYDREAAAVVLPNPNAPTGQLLALEQLRALAKDTPNRLLVVDEAYIDFGGESAIPLLHEVDNVIIVRTLSKSRALAGLRVGFALGSPELIEGLERVKDSFNSYPLDVVAQRAALASYGDQRWFETCCDKVMANREALTQGLCDLNFEVVPSAANFLFVKHRELGGRVLFDALRERGVIVRRWDKPRIEDYLRISVGTQEQCDRVLASLADILS